MAKLVVEILEASDLMPKDGHGSASPFVEVEFEEQRQRTRTKDKNLNPQWNEKLVFNVGNPRSLHNKTIDVVVYDDKKGGHHKKFLGRVRIYGDSVPLSELEASVQRYPLDKRGLFSHIKGDIALKIYSFYDNQTRYAEEAAGVDGNNRGDEDTPLEEIFDTYRGSQEHHHHHPDNHHHHHHDNQQHQHENQEHHVEVGHEKKHKMNKKEKEVRTFHTIGTTAAAVAPAFEVRPMKENVPVMMETMKTDFMRAGPAASVMRMQMQRPNQNPEFLPVETSPPLAARMRLKGGDKMWSTYDLVEQMYYLFVNVVKARDLPVMDITGSLDPYVEVKLGNYKGVTKHLDKNQNPIWKQTFAFAKEKLQSNLLEVNVKDKDFGKDDFVGRVFIDLAEVPLRVPPDSPLAPQWYKLSDKKGNKTKGEIMFAVWMGTQADESFPEAWHSDAHNITHSNLSNTRSKVYFSPKLYYLRVHIIEAQDLISSEKGRAPDPFVKVQLGNQVKVTRVHMRTINPTWNDELLFVAAEPFEDSIVISVEDRVGTNKIEILGRLSIPVREVPTRLETHKAPEPRWLNLHKHSMAAEHESEKKKERFSSKILIRLCLEAGYHVLDESTHFSSDLQPSSKYLRKGNIGVLELGILSARNLLPMKNREGKGTTDAYCVAKYGNKWVRTRTLLDTLAPQWNEQYTWEVYDPCTVITIGVFDNCHINGHQQELKDQRIGKMRIRLSTLETDRVYTHYYPLLILTSSGLRKHGELHLAIRFTCTAWVNMMTQYGKPLLPKMHYAQPILVRHIDLLRHQAIQIVGERLARAEPPLRSEVVGYMLDVDYHMWSLRRSKANFHRIMSLLSSITMVCRWFNDVCNWRNPVTTCLVHILFIILVSYPELILPTIFLYLFVIGIWNYRYRPRHPPYMDTRLSQAENVHPDELDEEFDSFPTSRSSDLVRMRYDRLRSVAGRVQTVVGDLATQGERTQAILSWRDSRATAIVIIFALTLAMVIYVTPLQIVVVLVGLYLLRHPQLRNKMPSVPVNFFKRLPAKSDMLL